MSLQTFAVYNAIYCAIAVTLLTWISPLPLIFHNSVSEVFTITIYQYFGHWHMSVWLAVKYWWSIYNLSIFWSLTRLCMTRSLCSLTQRKPSPATLSLESWTWMGPAEAGRGKSRYSWRSYVSHVTNPALPSMEPQRHRSVLHWYRYDNWHIFRCSFSFFLRFVTFITT